DSDLGAACTHTFEATYEFKVVQPGECIPAGLHVRINLETGLKEAKLLDPAENSGRAGHHLHGDEAAALAVLDVQGDGDGGDGSVAETVTLTVEDLAGLEEDVGDIDDGIDFVRSPASEDVVRLLGNADVERRTRAARVLGIALANNPTAQALAVRRGWMRQILTALRRADTSGPSTAALKGELFLLGALLRGSVAASEQFRELGGTGILKGVVQRTAVAGVPGSLQVVAGRVASVLDDLLDEDMSGENGPRWSAVRADLRGELVREWCLDTGIARLVDLRVCGDAVAH
ncbi:nucleotide exchange factor sil1, partial [Cladochytrium tenue]